VVARGEYLMPRVALLGGAYQARSVIAAAQRCLNLYGEAMPAGQGDPVHPALTGNRLLAAASTLTTYYPTPGLRLLSTAPQGPIRGARLAPNGTLYVCAGSGIYSVTQAWAWTLVGSITVGITTPVSMADNGLTLVIVDGTPNGWQIDLSNNTFSQISDTTGSFRGADRVDYLDTYLLFNVPGTPQFISSDSLATTFDPLWFANKQSYSDRLVTLCVAKRQIWLLGTQSTEVWYNTGAADFPFQEQAGVFIPHGCAAKYSVATVDNAVYWLSQTREGQGIVVEGAGYEVKRISTFAIEAEIAGYATISDAIGMTYQFAGHMFYVLTFPSEDKTWVFDKSTSLWHELAWIDTNGNEHRHRANCALSAFGEVVIGDWQNGNLYALDLSQQNDFGGPVKRVRSWPHLVADGQRIFYRQFLLDAEAGAGGGTVAEPYAVYLDWSDDRGHTFGNPVGQQLFGIGQYLTSMQWQRLGMARDRVFRVTWSVDVHTALQGAWVDIEAAKS